MMEDNRYIRPNEAFLYVNDALDIVENNPNPILASFDRTASTEHSLKTTIISLKNKNFSKHILSIIACTDYIGFRFLLSLSTIHAIRFSRPASVFASKNARV